jgi:tetratricopeptide (TPR) repeat protein
MQRIRNNRVLPGLLAAVLVLAATAAHSQDWAGRGRVQGRVSGPDGKALEGVKVTLTKGGVEGEGPPPFTTDDKGRWSYLGLAGGDYKILLEYEGLMPSEGEVKVSEFGAGPNIKIQMKEIPADVREQAAADERRKRLNEGNALLEQGQYAEARAAYEEVLSQIDESQHPALLRGIARTYYEEKNVDQAIAALEKALALVPDDAETLRLAVNLLVAEGREADAQKYMDRLPEGSGVDANTVLNLGIQRYNEDDYEGALQYFDRAAKENPDLVEVFYYRGLAHLGAENTEQALADFKKALEIDPTYKAEELEQFIEYLESKSSESQG